MSLTTDLSLPGKGRPFAFTRTYNSADSRSGPLGTGWTHSYATSLIVQPNGDVILRSGTGQQVYYTLQGTGNFIGAQGGASNLQSLSGGYKVTRPDQVVQTFDSSGNLTSETDRNGQGVSLSYGTPGLTTITDSAGRQIQFSYTSGVLSAVTFPDGRHVSYGYTAGRLTTVTDVRGGTTTYAYDSKGRVQDVTDQDGHRIVHNVYGSDGRLTQQTDARNNISTFGWNASTQTATMTDARNNQWRYIYNNNILQETIDPLGNTTAYGYDANLNLVTVTDPRGHTTSMTYDSRHNLLTRNAPAPLSYQEIFTYDSQNNLISYTNGRGKSTAYAYDSAGNLSSITQPGNTVTSFEHQATSGLLTEVTDARQKTTDLAYDSDGNLTSITDPFGHATTFDYDASGRMTSRVDPRGNEQGADPGDYTWTYGYDAANHLIAQTDPLGNQESRSYDAAGYLTETTDANDSSTAYGYDSAGNLTSVTAPDDTVTSIMYGPTGNLTGRTDANGHTTTYDYDAANRLTGTTDALNRLWTYSYDPNGNLTGLVDAIGNLTSDPGDHAITYGYDVLDRLTSIAFSDSTDSVEYEYDAAGNRTSMVDKMGTQDYVYDDLDQLESVTRGNDEFTYGYNAVGEITSRTYPDGTSATYDYNNAGQMASVTSAGAATTYGYDAAGNLVATTFPSGNGWVETRDYDRAGRLTAVENSDGSNVLSEAMYSLDPAGNPTSVQTLDGTATYAYDALDRLTDVCFAATCSDPDDPFIRYEYDSVGNRTQERRPGAGQADDITTYAYDSADQLTAVEGPGATADYDYDLNGNEVQAGDTSFTYDLMNQLRTVTTGSTVISYTYDGEGIRAGSTETESGVDLTKVDYSWDSTFGVPQLALERNGDTNSTLRAYIYGHRRISLKAGGSTYFYHFDGVGSVTNVTSATGDSEWTYSYEPFGATKTTSKDDALAPDNPMRFAGEYLDGDTYNLRARQYDPSTASFLQQDPLRQGVGDPAVSNYAYVNDRPTVWTDPSGQAPAKDAGQPTTLAQDIQVYCETTRDPACESGALHDLGQMMYETGGKFVIEHTCQGPVERLANWFSITNFGLDTLPAKGSVWAIRHIGTRIMAAGTRAGEFGAKVLTKGAWILTAGGTAADWWCRPFDQYLGQTVK